MAAKRGKSGVPQSVPRSELKVYHVGSTEGRIPVPSNLRKQRSLTNLAVLTDAEKKMQLYEPKWCDDMSKAASGHLKMGKPKPAAGRGAGGSQLSRNLSKSDHSLFQGKPKMFTPLAAPGTLGKGPSRIPRGPYVEVKPLSKTSDDCKSDDDILSGKAKASGKKPVAGSSGDPEAKGQGEEGGDKPFLKVDPELVVTVLGDLEQLLFSQMLDPESQRKRTVQNVLDLRQNLEETMSSLRGTHSVCYDSDETNARSISSLSNRSSPLSWRHGQSSPRLQAGDAPSSTGSSYVSGSKASSQYTSHTMPARCSSRLSHTSRSEFIEGLDAGDRDLKSGFLSDSDVLCKKGTEQDFITESDWDASSSISSGLSDGSDNLSSEELNASSSLNSLPTTPVGSRRNSSAMLRTDAEKRSLVESGLAWYSEDSKSLRKADGVYDTGSLKSEPSSKWRKTRLPDGSPQDKTGKGELKKPQSFGQPGSYKKGRNPPVGVTSPITHTSQSVLKVAGDTKAVDKVKMSVKATGLQRSRSDAGRDNEHRKPPSGLVKPSAGGSFGYKKPPTTGTATFLTAGGATITSGSATVGKTPKSSGIPIKPVPGGGGRKNSLDASGSDQGFLTPSARGSIQYRSLPRPAKSSTMSLTGCPSSRPVSGSIDASLLTLKPVPPLSNTMPTRGREGGSLKAASRPSTTGPVNQTDREKEKERAKAKADLEISYLKAENQSDSCGETVEKIHRVRRTSTSKYPELSSPTSTPRYDPLHKLNPEAVGHHDLPPKIPPYSKLQDLACSRVSPRLTPSPAPVLHIDSPSCFSGQALSVSSSPILYPKMSGLHRSMESLPLHMSVPAKPDLGHREETRNTGTWGTGSRTSITLGDSLQTDRNTFPKKGLSRCGSGQSEGEVRERRHSHTITSMTDSESPPQLPSPTHVTQPFLGKTLPTNVGESNTSQQIRILRRELESSQDKVTNLTNQLSANVRCIFGLSFQDSELVDLRETIEVLKTKNTEAQSITQGALNVPDTTPKELQIDRQNSSESISSLNSITSHSSAGSLKEQEAKKKKKKSWLRSSFNKAFSKKGSKAPYADIEEITTPVTSAPSSPKIIHNVDNASSKASTSTSGFDVGIYGRSCEGHEDTEHEEKVVSELRSELWEKERKLTDIRLEALSSAHQLEQLQEAMTNMQVCVRCCLEEHEFMSRLIFASVVDPGSSLGLSQDSIYSYSLSHLKRVLGAQPPETPPVRLYTKGSSCISVTLKGLKEKCVDVLVFETLIPKPMMQHYISLLLKHRRLILSGPSGTGKTYLTNRLAEYLVERSAREVTPAITTTFNMHRQSCKDLQLYLADLANQIDRESSTAEIPLVVILDDVHDATSLSELVNGALTCKYHKCPYIIGTTNQPVKMTPNHGLHLSFRMVMFSNNVEPANGFLVRYLHRKLMEAEDPRSLKNEDLLRVLDWVPRLWYHLHTFLEKHGTSDFLIGPCFFLSCPVTVEEFRTWFIDLWNLSIIPYLQEGAKDGIKVHGQKSVWEDPVEWVRGSLPWPSAQQDQAKLFHLPPPSTGPGSPSQPGDDRPHKETPPSSVESDPLMAMLLKLQEAANHIESPEKETDPKLPPL
uniref:Neuron navigator 1 n=1 Tax=Sinocyclocheilus rhinocerous TaxID=307959 RepID=A0A673JBJ1_9TELE